MCEIHAKLIIKTAERCQWRFGVFVVNFEQISYIDVVFSINDLNK